MYGSQDVRCCQGNGRMREDVPFPPRYSAGALIGKGGSNINNLQARTGAKLIFNKDQDPLTSVTVIGRQDQVAAAQALLLTQFKHFTATGGGYPHPDKSLYLLVGFPGAAPAMEFLEDAGDVAKAADRREALFKLTPSNVSEGAKHQTPAGGFSPSFFLSSDAQGVFAQEVTSAIKNACAFKPAFDRIKMHSNFGKNYFYNDSSRTAQPEAWKLQDGLKCEFAQLQEAKIPKHFKSVYSNGVSAAHVSMLKARLQGTFGFKEKPSKRVWSLHILLQPENCLFSISFADDGWDDGGLEVKKIKSSSCKLLFVSSLGSADTVDFRNKLLGDYSNSLDDDVRARLVRVANTCSISSSGDLHVGNLFGNTVSMIRSKTKQAYEGTYHAVNGTEAALKVTVVDVHDETRRRKHTEMTCRSSETKELLQCLLSHENVEAPALDPAIKACLAVHEFGHRLMGV